MALENILHLPEIVSSLEVEVRNERKRMALKRIATSEVILDPKHYKIIERYISDGQALSGTTKKVFRYKGPECQL
jgi:hypothetical protein